MGTSILELGTRTFCLFHAYLGPEDRIVVERIASERVSIDASVDATGAIGPNCWADAARVLGRLQTRMRGFEGAEHAFAPHALGGASNAQGFVDAIRRRLGISVELLSAGESARLAYHAARYERALSHPEGDDDPEPAGVIYVGDAAIDFAAGTASSCEFTETLPLGIVRLHRAYGATESGLLPADASALFSLVRLCGGPACRRLREWGKPTLVVGSENAKAVRNVARSWGYLDADANDLCRLSLHALVPEILGAAPESLSELGIDPSRLSLVGTTAVVIDALADLLAQRKVQFADCGVVDGAAVSSVPALDRRHRRVSEFRLANAAAEPGGASASASAATTLLGRYVRSTVA